MMRPILAAFCLLLACTSANAAIIQVTGTSTSSGQLGYFVVDEAVFNSTTSLVASDFLDFYFEDPLGNAVITPSNVPADTGVTHFGFISGQWTVTGGGGDSLTSNTGERVWIAGTNFATVGDFGNHDYFDVVWTTSPVAVPEPGSLLLWSTVAAMGFAIRRRRRHRA